jgi:hypothetical protein
MWGKLQVIVQLQQLSDLGVAISIDDFGTGFSLPQLCETAAGARAGLRSAHIRPAFPVPCR